MKKKGKIKVCFFYPVAEGKLFFLLEMLIKNENKERQNEKEKEKKRKTEKVEESK